MKSLKVQVFIGGIGLVVSLLGYFQSINLDGGLRMLVWGWVLVFFILYLLTLKTLIWWTHE